MVVIGTESSLAKVIRVPLEMRKRAMKDQIEEKYSSLGEQSGSGQNFNQCFTHK